MTLNLMQLGQMHPRLPESTAREYAQRAAVGLERHGHQPGLQLRSVVDDLPRSDALIWEPASKRAEHQLDVRRVTEDAAEAIALALVHRVHGWIVRRRLQRGEAADWLLEHPTNGPVALEISGVSQGEVERRLGIKLEQVRGATIAKRRVACVVELATPWAVVRTAEV